jgi:4-hydroxybenzoate polyprenyltransferase
MKNTAKLYLELIKFGHTIFALPFALIALTIATFRIGTIRILDVIGVLLCMIFARTSAMAFNRWADRDVDALNPRTASRAIPSGLLSADRVFALTLVSGLCFILSTILFYGSSGNTWPMIFSLPMLGFLLGYSYAKRWTWLSHVWLGCALAASPVAVWVALLPPGDWWPPFLLAAVVATWVSGFDIIYALQDLEVDRTIGLSSIPARFGAKRSLQIAQGLHLLTVLALVGFRVKTPELGVWFWWAVGVTGVLLVLEHLLARSQTVQNINIAFFQMNAGIGLGLLLAVLLDVLFKKN